MLEAMLVFPRGARTPMRLTIALRTALHPLKELTMSYTFGPVPSRRLGRSLGVDLVPFKTCTYDCIYCQLGPTTCKTTERKPFVGWEPILAEIQRKADQSLDYITLSGSGEPTLCTGLDELIHRIQAITTVPVAVLTNGSLLWRDDVRRELRSADLVIPSLDAGDDSGFQFINRPVASISFEQMMEGLIAFRQEFRKPYWLEVFLLAGYTSVDAQVNRLAAWVDRIQPDRVQLNTVTRPPRDRFAEPVPREQLTRLADHFRPSAEVVADYAHPAVTQQTQANESDILDMLQRRPCSVEDMGSALGLHRNEVVKYTEDLCRRELIETVVEHANVYYRARRPGRPPAPSVAQ